MANVQKESFNFKNLEPINYLKTFNKLRDHMIKNQPTNYRKGQLKIVNLTKFPLPTYYSQMEGIFQSVNRKNTQNYKNRQKALQQKQEEEFILKHKLFVKKTLQKIIDDNEKQQNTFMRTKQQFLTTKKIPQAQTLKLVKNRSEPKFGKINFNMTNSITSSVKNKQMTSSTVSLKRKISLLSNKHNQNNHQQNNQTQNQQKVFNRETISRNSIFKELVPPKKMQKYHKRDAQEIQDFLTTRKTFSNNYGSNFKNTALKAPPALGMMTLTERRHNLNQKQSSYKTSKKYKNPDLDQEYQQQRLQELYNDQNFIQELYQTTRSIPKNSQYMIQNDILKLQVQQSTCQGQFGSKLDQKIKIFKKKLDDQVSNIQSFKY